MGFALFRLIFSCITYLTSYHWTLRANRMIHGDKRKSPCPRKHFAGTRAIITVILLRCHPAWHAYSIPTQRIQTYAFFGNGVCSPACLLCFSARPQKPIHFISAYRDPTTRGSLRCIRGSYLLFLISLMKLYYVITLLSISYYNFSSKIF